MASPWVLECLIGWQPVLYREQARGWAAACGALGGGAEWEEVGP